jgi:hypothetical protein
MRSEAIAMRTSLVLLMLCLGTWVASPLSAAAQAGLGIEGVVRDQHQRPLEAVTVYLVHPVIGRSAPRFTDATGRYEIRGVPQAGEYFLEAYWGGELVYRQPVFIGGYVHKDITLG